MRKIFISLIILLVLVIGSSIFFMAQYFSKEKNPDKNVSTLYFRGDFAINTDNPREVVGYADHYFIVQVENLVETVYKKCENQEIV